MMRFMGAAAIVAMAGCAEMALELDSQLPSRQGGLVIYLTEPVVRAAAGSADLIAECGWQVDPVIQEYSVHPEANQRIAHFGVFYSGVRVAADGRVFCSYASDWNGGSVEELRAAVETRCNAISDPGVVCRPIYEIYPARYDPALGPSIGGRAGQDLLDEINRDGYGAVAISSNGAWSVRSEHSSREAADAAALEGCRSVVRNEEAGLTDEDFQRLEAGCSVIYRFGPDLPGSRDVTVIE